MGITPEPAWLKLIDFEIKEGHLIQNKRMSLVDTFSKANFHIENI